MSLRQFVRFLLSVGVAFVVGCGGGGSGDQSASQAVISSVTLNPLNSLSTQVTFEAPGADAARVVYWTGSEPEQATPFYPISPGSNTIATLGLKPSTLYLHTVEIQGPEGTSLSEETPFTSGELPQLLLSVALETVGTPTPGYNLLEMFLDNTTSCSVAFDNTGRLSWYRCFEEGLPASETKQQPNGNFTLFLGTSTGWQPVQGRFVEFTPSGEVVRNHQAEAPFFTDNHEIMFTMNGGEVESVHLFGYEHRTADLSVVGGPANVQAAGHLVLRMSPQGVTEFSWNAWDHLSVSDWIEPPDNLKQLPNIDFDHPNSLEFDHDGNYIVSFRHFGEVTKIDANTGELIWRLGGRNNQFTILDDPLGGFSAQHSARIMGNGNLLLYDNGARHTPPESRAVEYALDTTNMTATMVWEFQHDPPIFTQVVGAVQRLVNGDTLVSFGQAGHVDQVAADGRVVWEGDLMANNVVTSFYRSTRITSLYTYQRP